MALESGCHVVCEKPLCWDVDRDLDDILADGRAVVQAAEQASRSLVMSAQYPAVIPIYRDFYARIRGRGMRLNRSRWLWNRRGAGDQRRGKRSGLIWLPIR